MSHGDPPFELTSPHIPLGLRLSDGLAILRTLGYAIVEEADPEYSLKCQTPAFGVALYPAHDRVSSVWYDDISGRSSDTGRARRLVLYLRRYGDYADWEMRLDNGWMHYWFNPSAKVAMVYGVHNDVIRFNHYDGSHA